MGSWQGPHSGRKGTTRQDNGCSVQSGMSFGLSRGRELKAGEVGLTREDLPPLPDNLTGDLAGARLDPRAWFGHPERPLEIEIGSGKGTFLLQQAALEPGINFLGFEWAREFWLYAADRVRRRGLENVRLLNDDAAEFLHWRCPDAVARVIHLYFSDPWPKKRHHRRRVVQDRFLEDARRVLLPGGELRIVTDHDEYWTWMQEHFGRWTPSRFELLPFDRPGSASEGELVGTNFERKYRQEGRPFHAAVLRKRAGPVG
jgi:tRNA (guanine-N7-)-methyltransferase